MDVYFCLEGGLVKPVNRMLWSSLSFLPLPAPQNQTSSWIKHLKTAKELRQAVADALPEGAIVSNRSRRKYGLPSSWITWPGHQREPVGT
jgi:hypothetical protein